MKLLIKAAAFVLILALLACSGVMTALAEDAQESAESGSFRGAYYYRQSCDELYANSGVDKVDYYVYSDDYFRAPSSEYNSRLASMSMAVSEASAGSAREPLNAAGYARQSRNLTAILEDVGFSDIAVNDAYRAKPTKDSVGVACAHKQIIDSGKSYTLLAVVPRSFGYEAELGNSVLFGTTGDASGFSGAADKVLSFTRGYIADHGLQGEIKLWTVGYDRGAAIANLIAKRLIDDPAGCLGTEVTLTGGNLYAYTFGTPAAADVRQDPDNEKYRAIYNHISDADLSSYIPPTELGFSRYGTVKVVNSAEKKAQMKHLLAVCNRDIYTTYVRESDPDLFMPKRVNSSFSIVSDSSSYIPANARDYLSGLNIYLARFTGGRSGFASDYEKPLSNLMAYYGALSGDNAAAFKESIVNNKDTIYDIFAMYAYFMRLKSTGAAPTAAQEALKEQELAAVSALSDSDTDFSDRELYELMLRMIRYMRASPDTVLSDAASYLKNVLTAAMKASGATSSQISAVTGTKDLKATARFLSLLLFGNIWQSDKVEPYDYSNEQIKNAVTLLENYELLFSDHRNEVQKAWLRVDDSDYDDYAELTDAQRAGYRRVYLNASDGAALNGEVLDPAGEKVADVSNGVLINSTDPWLGYTATEGGGFLRVPIDADYRIVLRADKPCTLDVTIGEYNCSTAQNTTVLSQAYDVPDKAVVTVELPAPAEGHTIPTGAECSVTVELPEEPRLLGDADGDGEVSILDATAVQRYLADMDGEIVAELADVDCDGEIDVTDATFIQRWLADLPCPDGIGKSV